MRLYLDTSVYGGYYDDEFREDTRALFGLINNESIPVITSLVVLEELEPARSEVKGALKLLHGFELVKTPRMANRLAEKYINDGVLKEKSRADALHIAIATIKKASAVVSWNMKHMVARQEHYNAVNLQERFQTINIYTPTQIIKAYGYK